MYVMVNSTGYVLLLFGPVWWILVGDMVMVWYGMVKGERGLRAAVKSIQ